MAEQSDISKFINNIDPVNRYECDICGRNFDSASGRGLHMGAVHDTEEVRVTLITELQNLANKLDRTPTQSDMGEDGRYAVSTYQRKFGSWNEALKEAGFEINHEVNISKSDLIDELQSLTNELGRTPLKQDMNREGAYCASVYADRFGSWNSVLEEIGLELNRERNINESDLLSELQNLADELGRTPFQQDMNQEGSYSISIYISRFGSWNNALSEADLEVNVERNITKSSLVNELTRLANELGRTPVSRDMEKKGAYNVSTYADRFGSWNNALNEADLDLNREVNISKSNLVGELEDLADEIGETPVARDMNQEGEYSEQAYLSEFGSWNNALKQAGLEVNREHNISKSNLLAELQDLADRLGRTPIALDMSQQGAYSSSVYEKEFGSWNDALSEAGFDVNRENNISESALLAELQDLADGLGRAPTVSDMSQQGAYSSSVYEKEFGSWNDALSEAGFKINHEIDISKSKLLDELQRLTDELGRTPTIDDMKQKGMYSGSVYQRNFTSWNEALRQANLEINVERDIPKADLINELQNLANRLGRTPTQQDMAEKSQYSHGAYRSKFGSWTEALEEANLDPHRVYFPDHLDHKVRSTYEEEVANILLEVGIEYGYESLVIEYGEDRIYTPDFVTDRYVIEVKGFARTYDTRPGDIKKGRIALENLENKQYVVLQNSGPEVPADIYIPWKKREELKYLFK
jgi:hypothetical protein